MTKIKTKTMNSLEADLKMVLSTTIRSVSKKLLHLSKTLKRAKLSTSKSLKFQHRTMWNHRTLWTRQTTTAPQAPN